MEYLCGHNVDFMWLAEGRIIDHTTICKFRTRFRGPLAGECLDPKAKRGRTVRRDEHEPLREKMAAKMRTPQGKAVYNQRMHLAETPFAIIKSILGVRRFLLRGLEKVRTEWLWVCTAYNLRKLLAHMAGLRAELANMLAKTAG